MRLLLLALLFIFPSFSYSEPMLAPSKIMDFRLKLGAHNFVLAYLFKGDRSPAEGYLLPVSDLALLKIELDSFEDSINSTRNFFKKECKISIDKCQSDAHARYSQTLEENESLIKEVVLYKKLNKEQKNKTLMYSIVSGLSVGVLTAVIFKATD